MARVQVARVLAVTATVVPVAVMAMATTVATAVPADINKHKEFWRICDPPASTYSKN